MKILHQPAADPHDCADGLWNLGDRPIGTVVACLCGMRWECVPFGFRALLTFWRQVKPVGDNRLKLWRYHSFVVSDWDDVRGEEVRS